MFFTENHASIRINGKTGASQRKEENVEKFRKFYKVMTSREMLLYMMFGVGTASIDFLVTKLCYQTLPLPKSALLTTLSNAAAWVLSVTFAFVTNKLYVFKSRGVSRKALGLEVFGFYGARFLSLVLSIVFMVLLIDVLGWNADLAKLQVSAFVILFNYVFSKLVVFRDREKDGME